MTHTPASHSGISWEAGPVLVTLWNLGEGGAPFGVSPIPNVILYSDGRLIIRGEQHPLESQLTRQEVCALLNSIDNVGFFDFDLKEHEEELTRLVQSGTLVPGLWSGTEIIVNSWKVRQVRADLVDDPKVNSPAGLRNTYRLLNAFLPSTLQPYESAQIAFTLYQYPADSNVIADTIWPLTTPSLADLWSQAITKNRIQGKGILLEGEIGKSVYAVVEANARPVFSENGYDYYVSARPLLPYESLESAVSYMTEIPSPGIASTQVAWTCYFTDGQLPMP